MNPTNLQNLIAYIRGDNPALFTTTDVGGQLLIDLVNNEHNGEPSFQKTDDLDRPELINNVIRFNQPEHDLISINSIVDRSSTKAHTFGIKVKNWGGLLGNSGSTFFFRAGAASSEFSLSIQGPSGGNELVFKTGKGEAQKNGVNFRIPYTSLSQQGDDFVAVATVDNATGACKLIYRDDNGNKAEELSLTSELIDGGSSSLNLTNNHITSGASGDLPVFFLSHDFVSDQELSDLYDWVENDGNALSPNGIITLDKQPVEGAVVTYHQAPTTNVNNVVVGGKTVKQITGATKLGESITDSEGKHEYTGEAFDDTQVLGIKVDYMWWDTDKWKKYSKTEWSSMNLDLSAPS